MIEEKKPTRGRDVTRTPRQKQYLERLGFEQGKRLVVDLDAEGRANLEQLLKGKYGDSQKAVVNRSLAEAAAREKKKKKAC